MNAFLPPHQYHFAMKISLIRSLISMIPYNEYHSMADLFTICDEYFV